MSDDFVNAAKDNMGAIEALIKGLPGVKDYVDKELRRDADKRVRTVLANRLDEQKQALYAIQQKLGKSGGLAHVTGVDSVIQKLQTLSDRIKTASYGYAGLFDPVRVRADELDALHRFDVALAARTVEVEQGVKELNQAVDADSDISAATQKLADLLVELNMLFNRRSEAVESPDLLAEPSYPPNVDPNLLQS